MRLERFQLHHIKEIELRDNEKAGLASLPNFLDICRAYEMAGNAWTLFSPEGIVCIAGVFPTWPGVGTAWSFTSELVKKYPLSYFKATKKMMEAIADDMGLHRIQTVTRAEDETASRWACHLGFELEGTMKRYSPDGKDCLMFARVINHG